MHNAELEVEKPFEKEDELNDALKKLSKINKELDLDKKENIPDTSIQKVIKKPIEIKEIWKGNRTLKQNIDLKRIVFNEIICNITRGDLMQLKNNEIKDIIIDYLKNDKSNQAILIDGEWGSGKTFFIKRKK